MTSLVKRSIDALRELLLLPTVSDLAMFGPLGFQKTRRQLGRSETLRGIGKTVSLVTCGSENVGELGIGDALAQEAVITCTVGVSPNFNRATQQVNVRGRLKWGGDGHGVTQEFDWRQGTVIRPVGSAFVLEAFLVPDALGNLPTDAEVTVGAWIGYGSPTARGATLTQRVPNDGVVDIPPLAVGVSVYTGLVTGSWVADWYAGANVIGTATFAEGTGIAPPLPVPGGGANRLGITTEGTATALVVWELGF